MDAEREGLWAVVHCGNQKYIGEIKVVRIGGETACPPFSINNALDADWIYLYPVYEYFSPIRPMQVRGTNGEPAIAMTRDQFTTPFENMLHPSGHWVRATGISFFDEMHKEDMQNFTAFMRQVDAQRIEMRASKSGIVTGNVAPIGPNARRRP